MERRWGFGALLESISQPGAVFGPQARALFHRYAVASHLQHMTYEGADMRLERDTRSEERRKAIEFSHAARLIGDCVHMTTLRVMAVLRITDQPLDALTAHQQNCEALFDELDNALREWERVEYAVDH